MASRGINKVILVGNLGNDPEIRYMPNGGAVANITIATSDSWRDKATGEQREKLSGTELCCLANLRKLLANTYVKAHKFTLKDNFKRVNGKIRVVKTVTQLKLWFRASMA